MSKKNKFGEDKLSYLINVLKSLEIDKTELEHELNMLQYFISNFTCDPRKLYLDRDMYPTHKQKIIDTINNKLNEYFKEVFEDKLYK